MSIKPSQQLLGSAVNWRRLLTSYLFMEEGQKLWHTKLRLVSVRPKKYMGTTEGHIRSCFAALIMLKELLKLKGRFVFLVDADGTLSINRNAVKLSTLSFKEARLSLLSDQCYVLKKPELICETKFTTQYGLIVILKRMLRKQPTSCLIGQKKISVYYSQLIPRG